MIRLDLSLSSYKIQFKINPENEENKDCFCVGELFEFSIATDSSHLVPVEPTIKDQLLSVWFIKSTRRYYFNSSKNISLDQLSIFRLKSIRMEYNAPEIIDTEIIESEPKNNYSVYKAIFKSIARHKRQNLNIVQKKH